MKKIFTLTVLSGLLLAAMKPDAEESLAYRRVMLLYEERDFKYAMRAIDDYLHRYPENTRRESLWAIAGHIAFESGDFERALFYYEKIPVNNLKGDLQQRRWHCYFSLNRLAELSCELAPLVSPAEGTLDPMEEVACFYFAHCLFQIGCHDKQLANNTKNVASLREALSTFRKLETSSRYALEAKEAIVAIFDTLAETQNKENALRELAKALEAQNPVPASPLLLKCASSFSTSDPTLCVQLLEKALLGEGKKKSDCAVMLLSMLLKTDDFESLCQHESTLTQYLPPQPLALFHYFLGKMHLKRAMTKEALRHLEKTLILPLAAPHDRQALILLMHAAKKERQLPLMEKIVSETARRFADQSELIAQVEILFASTIAAMGESEKAYELLQKTKRRGVLQNEITLEMVSILSTMQRIEEADALIKEALGTSNCKKALYKAQLALLQDAITSDNRFRPLYERALCDAVAQNCFSHEEMVDLKVSLAKSQLANGHLAASLKTLEALLAQGEESADLFAMTSYTHLAQGDLEGAIDYGEKAVQGTPSFDMHLPLFNAYISLAKKKQSAELEQKAAFHLQAALAKNMAISLENRLWLFHKLGHRAQLFGDEWQAIEALNLIEPYLKDTHGFEGEIALAASLYALCNQCERGLALLASTALASTEVQKATEDPAHCEPAQFASTQFALAELYLAQGKRELALETFRGLQDCENSSIAAASKLQAIWLDSTLLKEKKRMSHEDLRTFTQQLGQLKGVRNAMDEPIHLQAALDFAALTANYFSDHERPRRLAHLLREIKQQFLTADDVHSKDYHEMLARLPDRLKIFESYMHYLEGWILSLEASGCEAGEREEKQKSAQLQFALADQYSSPYLRSRIKGKR